MAKLAYLNFQARAASWKPSHPLMGETFRWSAACLGWPQVSSMASSAFLLDMIVTKT
jgi:hypothetical protein